MIPELTAGQNARLETREFTLLEYGPAKIAEKNEATGPLEADYRSYYAGDSKEVRENGEKYMKGMYLADKLTTIDKTDPADLEKPFLLTFVATGNRGYTELNNASVAIRIESLFDRLPAYFTAEEDESEDSASKTNTKPRTVDWQITPFVTEWRYVIKAPVGFKIRALPPDKDEPLGSARFTEKYSTNQSGDVEATLRFDSGKARLAVGEAKALREAILKASKSDAIIITFDQIGYALLSAGKVKEAIAAFEQLATQHPKEALHKIQLAQVLMEAGLGEKARTLARQATFLEPNSAQAFSTLAAVMKHDLIGRSLKKGFDYEAALAAYRKAKQLDAKDKDVRLNLAFLLEYDPDGVRYGPKAHLEEAATEFQELYKMDKDYGLRYQDNVLFDLWYGHKLPTLAEYLATLPKSEVRKSFLVAITAAQSGADAALQQSLSITADNKERSQILVNAGAFLLRIRKYSEAAAMFEAGAHGQSNEAQFSRLAGTLRKTKLQEEMKIDPADPRSVAQELFIG
ncbi:MAG TPA: tetratricopeptide repeat protein, partial [Candidatus Angelobacter sp.]|nr:tetratricopeptide repeat protein [Candidatus Angelobacter sp.]